MNWFHFLIVENLNLRLFRTESTPFLKRLILTAEIPCILVLVVAKCCLLVKVVPFYGSVAVTGDEFFRIDGFPFETSTRVTCHSRSVADVHNLALVNVVNTHLPVGTCSSNELVIGTYF